jgi:DNA-binding SARP family transcriptional activator
VQLNILGPLEVVAETGPVDLGGPKQRAVLAILAVDANRVVSVDQLVDHLWGDKPPRRALGSLHAYVSNLRRLLEPDRSPRAPSRTLISRDPGYLIAVGPDDVDAQRFEHLAERGAALLERGEAADAVAVLDTALALWRGPVLADFAYESFVTPAAQRLEQIRRTAAEDRIDGLLALGRHAAVLADLDALVEVDRLRERTWGQLIVALYRSGRQADALRAYQRARRALVDELGIEPGPELRRLEQSVLSQDLDLGVPLRDRLTPARPPAAGSSEPAIIGREDELAQIDATLDALDHGHAGVIIVTGEPGVGKTALLEELARRAASLGLAVGVGLSPEDARTPPLWPWTEAFRRAAGNQLQVSVPAGAMSPSQVFDQLLAELRRLATAGGVVLVVDDLQWADELSLQFVQFLVTAARSERVLLAFGLREPSADVSDALLATKSAIARDPAARRIVLHGLDRHDVAELAARVTHDAPSAAVVDALVARTSGNPFFVTELARLLRAEHALQDVERMAAAGVPGGARDVIRRRLARLPEQAAVVLRIASVLGRRIDTQLVQHIASVSIDELLDLFELATVDGLLSEESDDPGVYRFNHDLVRDALYDDLSGLRRARLHSQAVDAILAVHGDTPALAHELARHAVAAVPHTGPDTAVERLGASARVAHRQLAVDLAERQLRLALSLLDAAPDTAERRRVAAELESRLAQIQLHLRGNPAEAAARIQRALDLCPPHAVDDYVEILIAQAIVASLCGDLAVAASSSAEALVLARRQGDRLASSDAEYCYGLIAWSGQVQEGVDSLARSVATAEQLEAEVGPPVGVHVPLATKRGLLAIALTLQGDLERADRATRDGMDRAVREGPWTLSWSAAWTAFAAVLAGDAEGVLRTCDAVTEQARGLAYTDALLDACRAWARAVNGSGPATGLDEPRRRLAEIGEGLMAVPLAALAAELRLDSGDVAGAVDLLTSARRQAESTGPSTWLAEIDRLLARAPRMEGGADTHRLLAGALEATLASGAGLFRSRVAADLAALGVQVDS